MDPLELAVVEHRHQGSILLPSFDGSAEQPVLILRELQADGPAEIRWPRCRLPKFGQQFICC